MPIISERIGTTVLDLRLYTNNLPYYIYINDFYPRQRDEVFTLYRTLIFRFSMSKISSD